MLDQEKRSGDNPTDFDNEEELRELSLLELQTCAREAISEIRMIKQVRYSAPCTMYGILYGIPFVCGYVATVTVDAVDAADTVQGRFRCRGERVVKL